MSPQRPFIIQGPADWDTRIRLQPDGPQASPRRERAGPK